MQPRGISLALVSLPAFVALGLACSSSQVDTQARVASTVAQTANGALPVIFGEGGVADMDLRHQLESACPTRACTVAQVEEIRLRVVEHWRPYVAAHESARVALDAWQDALRQCHAAGDAQCLPGMALLPALIDGAKAWRCAIRAAGYEHLDVLPLPAPVCAIADGGVR